MRITDCRLTANTPHTDAVTGHNRIHTAITQGISRLTGKQQNIATLEQHTRCSLASRCTHQLLTHVTAAGKDAQAVIIRTVNHKQTREHAKQTSASIISLFRGGIYFLLLLFLFPFTRLLSIH